MYPVIHSVKLEAVLLMTDLCFILFSCRVCLYNYLYAIYDFCHTLIFERPDADSLTSDIKSVCNVIHLHILLHILLVICKIPIHM